MVYRIYTEKRAGTDAQAARLLNEAKTLLGINRLQNIRVINRYDAENIEEAIFEECRWKIFAEQQIEETAFSLEELLGASVDEGGFTSDGQAFVFAMGVAEENFDHRADFAAQCMQLVSHGEKPLVRYARVYVLYGELMPADRDAFINYVSDPEMSVRVPLEKPETFESESTEADLSAELKGFMTMNEAAFGACISKMHLSMDKAELGSCVEYFRDTEQREPTITELRLIDAYWLAHRKNPAFDTVIDSVIFNDPLLEKAYKDYLAVRRAEKRGKSVAPVTLDDILTMTVKQLRRNGRLDKLDVSDDSVVCTVKINVEISGENEPWLLLFRNISADGTSEGGAYAGAAAQFGGCVRDTLSGRAYAYAVMRVSAAADPLKLFSEAIPGKLPQRTETVRAAGGFSDYANRAGICTGYIDELYHPGYEAGRMETGAVLAAVPAVNVRNEEPEAGDSVMLIGTGEARSGSAAEERRLQRLLRNPRAARMIKRCNGVSTGGLAVAVGSLADGIDFDLSAVPEAFAGSESAEDLMNGSFEMLACVIDPVNESLFRAYARDENLPCVEVASVTEAPRFVMRSGKNRLADISKEFLKSGRALQHIDIAAAAPGDWESTSMFADSGSFTAAMHNMAQDLNTCSKRGLAERFDSTAGSGAVLMPFGGSNQITPVQAMVRSIPSERASSEDCSVSAYGFNPYLSEASPYHGAYLAVVESVSKLIAAGASCEDIYLTLHEYSGNLGDDSEKWGKVFAAALGAFEAQQGLGLGAAGISASTAGSFDGFDVPQSLVSFAFTMGKAGNIISPEFKTAGHRVILLRPYKDSKGKGPGKGLPDPVSVKKVWEKTAELIASGTAVAAYTPGMGGIAEAVMKMCYGNGTGFHFSVFDDEEERLKKASLTSAQRKAVNAGLFGYSYGCMILELKEDAEISDRSFLCEALGYTTEEQSITLLDEKVELGELLTLYEGKLESVFPAIADGRIGGVENINYKARSWNTPIYKRAEPKVLIPVFPGTNCEYDVERCFREAGAVPEILVMKNRSSDEIRFSAAGFAEALKEAQMVFIPGGFAGGDEPDGAAKFIEAFFRNEAVTEGITDLLDKNEGLIGGAGSGFQALLRLGLLPYGKIVGSDENSPLLTYNSLGFYQSRMVKVRVSSNKSPWLRSCRTGEIYCVPVSHGAGKFVAPDDVISRMAKTGQIATQYVDAEGNATGDIRYNPNGSMMAVEGITSPDGRVFGRMGHAERTGNGLYRNVEGECFTGMFENAVRYFR